MAVTAACHPAGHRALIIRATADSGGAAPGRRRRCARGPRRPMRWRRQGEVRGGDAAPPHDAAAGGLNPMTEADDPATQITLSLTISMINKQAVSFYNHPFFSGNFLNALKFD